VGSNGRTTAQLSGFTHNLVLYQVSNNSGYFLQADTAINIGGEFSSRPGREVGEWLVTGQKLNGPFASTNPWSYAIASAAIFSVTNASITSPTLMSP